MEQAIRLVQVVSPGKYIQDMLLFTLFLVFFYRETSFPLPYLTLMSVLFIAASATLLYRKIPFSTGSAVILTVFFHLPMLLFDASVILYLVVSALSIWRLQSRFGTVQLEGVYDLPYISIISVLYVILASASIFFGLKDELSLLSGLLLVSVVISVGTRLVEQWLKADPLKNTSRDIVSLFAIVTGTGIVAYGIVRYFGSSLRAVLEWVVLKVMALFLPFIGVLIEKPIAWLQGLIAAREQEEEEEPPLESQGMEERDPFPLPTSSEADFPWIPILIAAAIILFILVVYHMMKKRREFEQIESFQHEVERGEFIQIDETSGPQWIYSMDSHIVREAFLQFEAEAAENGWSRSQEETVREWFKRMEWEADSRFFSIYDAVRYGAGRVPEVDGNWFLNHLNEIKLKFFKKDV